MRNKVFGFIVMVWGGVIVARFFLYPPQATNSAYQAGTVVGVVFGAILFGIGLHALLKKPKPAPPSE